MFIAMESWKFTFLSKNSHFKKQIYSAIFFKSLGPGFKCICLQDRSINYCRKKLRSTDPDKIG
jgi:hypothetical protein